MKQTIAFLLVIFLCACANTNEQVNSLLSNDEITTELAKDVEILYSDSAQIKLKITGPSLKRHLDPKEPKEEFTDGIHVEFFGPNKNITSWLDAKYAIRKEKEAKIVVRDSVILYNKQNEKLETSELIWDEKEEKISTNKFVRITQPEKGDTSYGYGFESDNEFSKFAIKNFSAKMNAEQISNALGQKKK